jgi:two-component system sensor kinase FixL
MMVPLIEVSETRDVLEKTTDCVFILDHGWRLVYLNSRAREVLQEGRGDLLGQIIWEAFPDSRDTCAWSYMNEAAASGNAAHFEFFLGSLGLWFEVHAYPVAGGMQVYFRDVTARRQTEVRERAATERLALAQSGAGAGTWDLDLRSGLLHLCPRSLEMHGFPSNVPGPLHHEDWQACVHADDLAGARSILAESIRSGATYRAEYRARRSDGFGWVLGLGQVVRDESGEPVRFVGLNFDISEKKRNAAELERLQAELVHVARLSGMGAMASTLAHELNQPLTAALTYSQALRRVLRDAPLEKIAVDALDGILDSTGRAGRIIRQLREYVAKGRVEQRRENLAELVDGACLLALAGEAANGIQFGASIDPQLHVFVERTQIQQVLVNLLRNAVEAMQDSGGRELCVSANTRDDGMVEVSVADTGSGIPPEVQPHLFSPFVTSKREGMGIGLSICRTIVEGHGGQIWADRDPAGGTTFRFTLLAG